MKWEERQLNEKRRKRREREGDGSRISIQISASKSNTKIKHTLIRLRHTDNLLYTCTMYTQIRIHTNTNKHIELPLKKALNRKLISSYFAMNVEHVKHCLESNFITTLSLPSTPFIEYTKQIGKRKMRTGAEAGWGGVSECECGQSVCMNFDRKTVWFE